jgi:hypothetical protein
MTHHRPPKDHGANLDLGAGPLRDIVFALVVALACAFLVTL